MPNNYRHINDMIADFPKIKDVSRDDTDVE